MIAFHREARDRAEQVRVAAEAVQVRNGLFDQQIRLPPRPLRQQPLLRPLRLSLLRLPQ